MHFEVPKAKKLKEFGGEYVMIVISILTALLLEHAVQSLHHRHLAHEAAERIDAELQANIRELDTVLAHNVAQADKLTGQIQFLREGIRNKVPDAELLRQWVDEQKGTLSLSIKGPTFKREAWDVSVANQSISWMDAAHLERYSGAYASMRDIKEVTTGGGMSFLNGPAYRDVISDLQAGETNARAVYRTLAQMRAAYDSMNGNLDILKRELQTAVAAAH